MKGGFSPRRRRGRAGSQEVATRRGGVARSDAGSDGRPASPIVENVEPRKLGRAAGVGKVPSVGVTWRSAGGGARELMGSAGGPPEFLPLWAHPGRGPASGEVLWPRAEGGAQRSPVGKQRRVPGVSPLPWPPPQPPPRRR